MDTCDFPQLPPAAGACASITSQSPSYNLPVRAFPSTLSIQPFAPLENASSLTHTAGDTNEPRGKFHGFRLLLIERDRCSWETPHGTQHKSTAPMTSLSSLPRSRAHSLRTHTHYTRVLAHSHRHARTEMTPKHTDRNRSREHNRLLLLELAIFL